jgi:glycosyltransferase involved in cell wall biosynthesis
MLVSTLVREKHEGARRLVTAAQLEQMDPNAAEITRIRNLIGLLARRPRISILMPTFNTREDWLRGAIESVLAQLYPEWELCIADDASTEPHVRHVLEEYAAREPRIRLSVRSSNGGIAAASQTALNMGTGEFIALLDHDDELAPHALFHIAREIGSHPDAELLYTDEDKINPYGLRCDPYFKPDWNPDLFLSHNLVTHLAAYRAARVRAIGGFRPGFDGAQDYDLTLRFVAGLPEGSIVHIPVVLYHWRKHPDSTASSPAAKQYAAPAARRAILQHLVAQHVVAEVLPAPEAPQCHRVKYALPDKPPQVTLIIPTRNGLERLEPCVEGILTRTDYGNLELLIADNGTDDPAALAYLRELEQSGKANILRASRPFTFSALLNWGAHQVRGGLLGVLNSAVEVLHADWLTEMVSHAVRPAIGVVGARLWYPDCTLQHAGVILGIGGVAGHAHKHLPKGLPGYAHRAILIQNFSAVTAACMLMRKCVFDEVDGFDESLSVAFNDVDFCLRVKAKGYWILWTPYAELLHRESVTRGDETSLAKHQRFAREVELMQQRWGSVLTSDPAYNPNLTLERTDFSIAWPPRSTEPNARS